MKGVCWHRLQLSGFGVHDNLDLGLDEGLVVFVARNERGKSTAVAGLTAVVFGLPASKDRAAWGQARFRSHRGGSRFEGTVEFSARDGQRYRLWRNFDTQMVRLSRKTARGYEVVFEGEHKPNARRGAVRYEEYLDALLGMTSHELFSSTFSVQQPLAGGHQLSQEVSALLAGSGGGSHRSALEELEREITQRTKYTRQYGLPGSNKSKNRDLEEIEESIQAIKTAVREGGAAADALQEVQKKLAGAVGEEETLKTEVERAYTKAQAAKAWVEVKDRHDREQRAYSSLKRKLNEARRLEEKIAEAVPATSERPERTWSFVEGRAALYVRRHRDDAQAALREYKHLLNQQEGLQAHEAERNRFILFQGTPEDVLSDLAAHDAMRARLALERKRAEEELARARGAQGNPDVGFEDVAELSAARIEELRGALKPKPPLGALLAFGGLAVGVAAAFLAGLELTVGLLVGVVLAALGFVLGGRLTTPRGVGREEAQRLLERYAVWQARRETVVASADVSAYEARLDETVAAVAQFETRMAPYAEAYGNVGEAFRAFREAQQAAVRFREAGESVARQVWGVPTAEVGPLDPARVAGHWGRLATFARALGEEGGTVYALVRALQQLGEHGGWEELERDAARWDDRETARQAWEQEQRTRKDTLTGILRAETVASVDELEERVESQLTRAVAELRSFQEVCEAHPELPRYDDPEADREQVTQLQRRYEETWRRNFGVLEALRETIQELRGQRAEAQGKNPVNVAAKEIELEELAAQQREVQAEIGAYALAYATLKEAVTEYQDAYLERLSDTSGGYFAAFTGKPKRRVEFAPDFNARIVEHDGVTLAPTQLSQGAQDQLAIAVRLAVADMIADNLSLPLVFDDPFHNCDEERLMHIQAALSTIAERRQVLMLSHLETYRTWGNQVEVTLGVV